MRGGAHETGTQIVKQERERRQTVKVGVRTHARKIERVYLAVTELADGEGVYTVVGPQGEVIPIVALNEHDLASLQDYASGQARATGQRVSIICFTRSSHHETLPPVATGDNE